MIYAFIKIVLNGIRVGKGQNLLKRNMAKAYPVKKYI